MEKNSPCSDEVFGGSTKDFDAKRQYSHDLRLESKLSDLRSGNANLGPTGYTPCEYAFGVGATHPASFHDALTEQSASFVLANKLADTN